ncbi:MAG: endonuclease domain-containing protein [Bacteroidia bacterium]|nr:endonuclease domain-containing protein [Bacteroidia bacterium]
MFNKNKIIPYNPELKDLARKLRRNMTLSEILLWNELRNKQMSGFDFDRQKPIDNFIVDFFCKELSLAIEIDGDTHIFRNDYDDERQKCLENLGIRFLRFDDNEVKKSMNNVLRVIQDWIIKNQPTPNPSQEGSLKMDNDNSKNQPTPSPSQEGSLKMDNDNSKNQPTTKPHREWSLK